MPIGEYSITSPNLNFSSNQGLEWSEAEFALNKKYTFQNFDKRGHITYLYIRRRGTLINNKNYDLFDNADHNFAVNRCAAMLYM